MALKVCVVTGGRADYGLVEMPMRAIRASKHLVLQLIVTGQHLNAGGLRVIERGGFVPDAVIDMQLGHDDPQALTHAAGRELGGLADAFARLTPDIVLLLGDRYEILAAAYAALVANIPIAHLCGGDVTEGAFDDAIRHAITKLAHLHFVTNAQAQQRVRQMGEQSSRIHLVGSPGIDAILNTPTLTRADLLQDLKLPDRERTFLITFHPATLSASPVADCREMLAALDTFADTNFIFTGVNADPGASSIAGEIQAFCDAHPDSARYRNSLGAQRYYSALAHSDVVVGNSSSGLYEAPSFGIPTVNIGERQTGRIKATSVFDCPAERSAIEVAIVQALRFDATGVENPYGDGHTSSRIVSVLEDIKDPKILLRKRFQELAA